jgi:hypothetical protein
MPQLTKNIFWFFLLIVAYVFLKEQVFHSADVCPYGSSVAYYISYISNYPISYPIWIILWRIIVIGFAVGFVLTLANILAAIPKIHKNFFFWISVSWVIMLLFLLILITRAPNILDNLITPAYKINRYLKCIPGL